MLQLTTAIKIAAILSYVFLALLTMRSDSRPRVRRFFSIYLLVLIYWQFVSLMLNFSKTPEAAVSWYNLLIPGTELYSVLFFPFTRAFLDIKGQKRITFVAYAACGFLIVFSVVGIPFSEVRMGRGEIFVPEMPLIVYLLRAIGYSFWIMGVFNLIREVVKTDSSYRRNRIMYLLLGSAFVISGTAANFTLLKDYPVDIAINLINAGLVGYAVIRHRPVATKIFLAKSLFYSVFIGMLVGLYFGCILLLESAVNRSIGYNSPISATIAVVALSIVFLPLRNGVQVAIDKLFSGERYDYQGAVETFSRAVTSIRNPDELTNLVARTTSDTFRSRKVLILLPDENRVVFTMHTYWGETENSRHHFQLKSTDSLVEWMRREAQPVVIEEIQANSQTGSLFKSHGGQFRELGLSVIVPILLKNRLTGILCLGQKLSGAMYTDQDVRFLTTLANQTATALDNAMVYMEVERRLSEQTLLFILSEAFRRSLNIDDVVYEAIGILKAFLKVEICGILYLERSGSVRIFSDDPLSDRVLRSVSSVRSDLIDHYSGVEESGYEMPEIYRRALNSDPDLPDKVKHKVLGCVLLPLKQQVDLVGLLLISKTGGDNKSDQQSTDVLRTIGAIISQGIMLQRTVADLVGVKSYNENILNSLNDMGDTLIVIDLDRIVKSANGATCTLLGYQENELVGNDISFITRLDEELFTAEGFSHLIEQGSITNYELFYRNKDGDEIPMLFSGSLLADEDGEVVAVVGMARDITEHKRAAESKKNLLLVREIHHRIKNNLQVISSLLYLQSGYVDDETTKEMFIESQNRVRSMALIHENLYQSEDMAGIDFGKYLRNLTHNLMLTYATGDKTIYLDVELNEQVILGMDTAIPCGLIINELVTNALKYAFHGFKEGAERRIKVDLQPMGEKPAEGFAAKKQRAFCLRVIDNGTGLPPEFDISQTDTLGLRLVTTLAEQLDGQVTLNSNEGTEYVINFVEA
ncbi:MAG: hypothetical protein CMN78_00150 [Spirochaetales bacterium]|nr:hypothetical protein [Spirochaetales bacterium]